MLWVAAKPILAAMFNSHSRLYFFAGGYFKRNTMRAGVLAIKSNISKTFFILAKCPQQAITRLTHSAPEFINLFLCNSHGGIFNICKKGVN